MTNLTEISPNDLPADMLRLVMHQEEEMLKEIMKRQQARNNFTLTHKKAPATAKEYAAEANDMIQLFQMYISQSRKLYERFEEYRNDSQTMMTSLIENADLFEQKYEELLLKRQPELDELPF